MIPRAVAVIAAPVCAMPSRSSRVWMLRVTPRPAKRSEILPIPTTSNPCADTASSTVGAVGRNEKSRRRSVRAYPPRDPTHGRAMTRLTPSPRCRQRTDALQRHNPAQAERLKLWHAKPAHGPGGVRQRAASLVPVPPGIRKFTDTGAVQDDDHDTRET